MKPGINLDIPESEYFAFDACSNSRLSDMLESPAECKFNIDHPSQPTPAMVLGSAVDTLVFTPHEFNNRFRIYGQCAETTGKGARCSNMANKTVLKFGALTDMCGVHGRGLDDCNRLSVLSEDDLHLARAMRDAVYLHSTANQILGECDAFQLSLVWDYQGMPCKARLDGAAWELDSGTIVDLKKWNPRGSGDSVEAFSRTIWNLGYFRQAAFYRWAAQQCGRHVANFVFIVVDESKVKARLKTGAPELDILRLQDAVTVYRLQDEAIYHGELQLQPLLAKYRECWTTGEWPRSEDIVDVDIPAFAKKSIERSLIA